MALQTSLDDILSWQIDKPTTDAAWIEDIKRETLHIRAKKELNGMKSSLEVKLPRVQEDLDKFDRYPDAVRYDLEQQFKEDFNGQALIDIIEEELESQHNYYRWKVAKINQSTERIDKELDLRTRKIVSKR